jgi:predicted TIM-barrel fold metal-dependent hydrolase
MSTSSAPATTGLDDDSFAAMIDVHAHAFLPSWLAMYTKVTDSPSDAIKFAGGILPKWSVERHLDTMDRHGIATSILSWPGATGLLEGAEAQTLARRMNEEFAEIVADHPTRFGAFAVVSMDDVDAAAEETVYALDVLELDGVSATASFGGRYLGHASFDPWFSEMDRRSATLFAHPGAPPNFDPHLLGMNVALLEFMFESTRMVANMVLTGATSTYPAINVISTHGGGTIPYLSGRLSILQPILGSLRSDLPPLTGEEIADALTTFHYDLTASTTAPSLRAIEAFIPADKLLVGFDFPMMPDTTIAPARANLVATDLFDAGAKHQISRGNALELLPRLRDRLAAHQGAA